LRGRDPQALLMGGEGSLEEGFRDSIDYTPHAGDDGSLREGFREWKAMGFTDARIGQLAGWPEEVVAELRERLGVEAVFKRVDTCAAEFEATTPYLYSTYESECEAQPGEGRKVLILGGGPNRIGQGIEFDYCCVHAARALAKVGYETIMINCNPETVSTDYDTSDRLYFEPLTFEHVMNVIAKEAPEGVVVQLGGQTPLSLARRLWLAGVRIMGTSPSDIDRAEDRDKFKELVDDLGLLQPDSDCASTKAEALRVASQLSDPVLVRPYYVLGGRAMKVVYDEGELENWIEEALAVSELHPVLIDRYLEGAVEVDVDAVSDGKDAIVGGVL